MKLANLNEDDFFQNKPHASTAAELAHVKHKLAAFTKERGHNNEHIADLYNEYEEQYKKNNTIKTDFKNSSEFAAYEKVKAKLQDRSLKLCSLIKNAEQEIMQLSSKDMFDEQKNACIQAGYRIPVTPPAKIPTGPNTSTKNPYYDPDVTKVFAGFPWDYKWWVPKTIRQYTKLSKYLKEQNLQGFVVLYAGKGTAATKFVAIGDHGNFVWRANVSNYGNGTGITHSSVRVNGSSYSTKQFINSLKP